MNHTSLIIILFSTVTGIILLAIWSNTHVYAQQTSSHPIPTRSAQEPTQQQNVAKIKITSPTKGQQVPVGKDITISGTSIDNAVSNNDCKVSVIANKVRPYQPATATGTGGEADYSKWKFDITSKYTTIKPGPNRITAKYECRNNAALTSFSSVNVIGIQQAASTPTPTPTSTNSTVAANTTIPTPTGLTPLTSSPSSVMAPRVNITNKQEQQQPQLLPTISNGTEIQNYTFPPTSSVLGSDKLIYLGYHGGNDTSIGKSSSSTTSTRSDSSSNHNTNRDSNSKNPGNSNTESSNHHGDGTASHDTSAGKKKTSTSSKSVMSNSNSTFGHISSNGDKNNSDKKSSAPKNDGSKFPSSTSSFQPNGHKNNDSDESKKAKMMKNSRSPKENDNHKRDGDGFFGGDPFFNDDDDDF